MAALAATPRGLPGPRWPDPGVGTARTQAARGTACSALVLLSYFKMWTTVFFEEHFETVKNEFLKTNTLAWQDWDEPDCSQPVPESMWSTPVQSERTRRCGSLGAEGKERGRCSHPRVLSPCTERGHSAEIPPCPHLSWVPTLGASPALSPLCLRRAWSHVQGETAFCPQTPNMVFFQGRCGKAVCAIPSRGSRDQRRPTRVATGRPRKSLAWSEGNGMWL